MTDVIWAWYPDLNKSPDRIDDLDRFISWNKHIQWWAKDMISYEHEELLLMIRSLYSLARPSRFDFNYSRWSIKFEVMLWCFEVKFISESRIEKYSSIIRIWSLIIGECCMLWPKRIWSYLNSKTYQGVFGSQFNGTTVQKTAIEGWKSQRNFFILFVSLG